MLKQKFIFYTEFYINECFPRICWWVTFKQQIFEMFYLRNVIVEKSPSYRYIILFNESFPNYPVQDTQISILIIRERQRKSPEHTHTHDARLREDTAWVVDSTYIRGKGLLLLLRIVENYVQQLGTHSSRVYTESRSEYRTGAVHF